MSEPECKEPDYTPCWESDDSAPCRFSHMCHASRQKNQQWYGRRGATCDFFVAFQQIREFGQC
jgi:hypothetical protein